MTSSAVPLSNTPVDPVERGNATNRRRVALMAVVCVAMVSLSGCYRAPKVNDINDELFEKNFVTSCTQSTSAAQTTTSIEKLADEDRCRCILNDIRTVHKLTLDRLKQYETDLAKVKPGEAAPTPPEELTLAIKACEPAGPTFATTTTTAVPQ